METRCFHKKLEFQRYSPKDFCTARYERKSLKKKFQTFQNPERIFSRFLFFEYFGKITLKHRVSIVIRINCDFFFQVEKRQLWVWPFEWLKLNFSSCVVHQTRSNNMFLRTINKPTMWLLILSFTKNRSRVFYVLSLWRIYCIKNTTVWNLTPPCKETGLRHRVPLAGLPISLVHGGYLLWPRRRSRETALLFPESWWHLTMRLSPVSFLW